MANVEHLRGYIDKIHATNSVACNVPQVLDSLDITVSSVPTINLYLFELLQNALDAGATSIEIQVNGIGNDEIDKASEHDLRSQRIVFLHNGPGGFGQTEQHVRGMSNVFQSTKSVGSVGFMGFGFKTLYKRFTSVSVSDSNGWKFGFDVPEKIVALHPTTEAFGRSSPASDIVLKTRGWVGAVCPTWDETIVAPDGTFSTRFELSGVVSATFGHPLFEDVNEALFSGGMTALAVLGTQGLRQLRIIDRSNSSSRQFELVSSDREGVTVMQTVPSKQSYKWKCLVSQFEPGIEATQAIAQARLKNILQHHKDMEKVITDIKKPYRVLGLVPVAYEDGIAQVNRGQLFATLPIRSFVPFGISIQADWLLDLSRKGLRDVETNPWQQTIVNNVANLIAKYLLEIKTSSKSTEEIACSFAIFGSGVDALGNLDAAPFSLDNFGSWIKDTLKDQPIFPTLSASANASAAKSISDIEWRPIDQVVLLPHTHYRPRRVSNLIGFAAIDESLVSHSTCKFFVQIGLLKPLNIVDIVAKFSKDGGIGAWYNSLDKSEALRRDSLVELWAFLAEFAPPNSIPDLKCIPAISASQTLEIQPPLSNDRSTASPPWIWTSPTKVTVFDHGSQYKDLPDDEQALKFIASSIPSDSLLLPPTFLNFLLQKSGDWNGPGRVAFEWISKHWCKKGLKQFARRSFINSNIATSELAEGAAAIDRFEQSSVRATQLGALLAFTKWAVNNDLADLITHFLPSYAAESSTNVFKPVENELLVIGAPYVDSELALIHTRLFSKWRPVHPIYASLSINLELKWSIIFNKLRLKGPVVLEELVTKELSVHPSYVESRKVVADILEIPHESVLDFQTTSRKGWKIVDTVLKDADLDSRPEMWPYIANWLEANVEALERGDSMLVGQGEVWRVYVAHGKVGTASWCRLLNRLSWVPQVGSTERVKPFEVRKECVLLTARLVQVLEKKGVYFGRTSAQKQVLDRIASFGSSDEDSSPERVQHFAEDLLEVSSVDPSQYSLIAKALNTAEIPLAATGDDGHSSRNNIRSKVKLEDLVLLDPSDSESIVSDLTLNHFLVTVQALPKNVHRSLQGLHELGVVNIPAWPTADQSLRFFRSLSLDKNHSQANADMVPKMFEFLAADQTKLRTAISTEGPSLRLPPLNGTAWLALNTNEMKSVPLRLCGESTRVQKLVKSLILALE
jgi:hypothetical protein